MMSKSLLAYLMHFWLIYKKLVNVFTIYSLTNECIRHHCANIFRENVITFLVNISLNVFFGRKISREHLRAIKKRFIFS